MVFQTVLGLFNSFIGVPYYFEEFELHGLPHTHAVRAEIFPKFTTGTVPVGVSNICDAKVYLLSLYIFFFF